MHCLLIERIYTYNGGPFSKKIYKPDLLQFLRKGTCLSWLTKGLTRQWGKNMACGNKKNKACAY